MFKNKSKGNTDYAVGRLKAGVMNDTEKKYEELLNKKLSNGELLWYKFEGITLKLAEGVRYTPDFFVMNSNNELEVHEVKGFWRGDALVKIKLASDLFPFKFFAVKKNLVRDGGGFSYEEF